MSASDHLHPFQMKLFMQAKELIHLPAGDHDDELPMTEAPELREEKLNRAKTYPRTGKTLYEDIKESGVKNPVSLYLDKGDDQWEQVISNGHHRIASAYDINPEMWLPVTYW